MFSPFDNFFNAYDSDEDERYDIPKALLSQALQRNPNYLKLFSAIKSNSKRVDFVYGDLKKYNLLKFVRDDKDHYVSIKCKEFGDNFSQNGFYSEASVQYTITITTAKTPQVLASAYAKRANSLFICHKYDECLADIERALALNCPQSVKKQLATLRTRVERIFKRPKQPYHEPLPTIRKSRKNPQIQCAKNCVEIKHNETFGRHVVATRDINIGEVICIEKPYASILCDFAPSYQHCHHCLELCYNPIPCEKCSQAWYCTDDCREEARNMYHSYECLILKDVFAITKPRELLALRVAILAKNDYKNLDFSGLDGDVYRSDRYQEIHNLMTGEDGRPVDKLFEMAVMAACMFHLLQKTDFFNEPQSDILENNFKEVLLHQMQIIDLNKLVIYEDLYSQRNESRLKICGDGLYSFCSLFNHSCFFNVDYVHYGATIVLRAIHSIKKGEQCFISYGAEFGDATKYERQSFLKKHYFFECKCEACAKDWQKGYDLLPFKFPLHLDLKMSEFEVATLKEGVARHDVDVVKQFLRRVEQQSQRHDVYKPLGNTIEMKKLIEKCHRVLANGRN
ncbi:SET and MYND domain-containing protein 4-like [Tribolium madens]|uniref:SET and MYND domain-containing protein 4-like n=1 Tax=Tribolium madens TaxID=41895 RepID=UPI001CF7249C|nr:SET and MYND domain-containing protein 4-like [Tribolium madens]XP_044253607.1 SET and MYND domain-containing protein 4-like [Tribolium madens]XP_044253608.1 SET and MYND domain-containing protein 4-like [Tribolium madens]XP_044253611.1 SET and MYND domain-containing protein 4-like [Tribolium madens]